MGSRPTAETAEIARLSWTLAVASRRGHGQPRSERIRVQRNMRRLIPTLILALAGAVGLPFARGVAAPRPQATTAVASPPAKAAKPAPKAAPSITFTPSPLELAPGETYPVTVFVPSPTGRYHKSVLSFQVKGGVSVQSDPRFPDTVPPWGVKVFPKIQAGSDAAGTASVVATLIPGGSGTLNVSIKRPTVSLIPAVHQLRIQVTNPMQGRPLKGRVSVSNPDRFLGASTGALLEVPPGSVQEVQIPLPGAAPVEGETYAFTYTLETWSGYQEKKTLNLRFPPQPPAQDG
jgi:hypothetical protein